MTIQMNYSKSNKITGLEEMESKGFLVPRFDYIPDFSELNMTEYDLNVNYLPEMLFELIKEKLKPFNLGNGISVRSASFDEDSTNQSSAGRYISFNGLSDINDIVKSAIQIWIHHRSNSKNVLCPLIIQETHPSYYSGVAFKDGDTIIIESYYGACSNIVNGSIRPYITSSVNGEVSHNYSANSNYTYLYSVHKNVFSNPDCSIGERLFPNLEHYTYNTRLYCMENEKIMLVYGNRPSSPVIHYEDKILPQLFEILNKLDNPDGVDVEFGSDIEGNVYMYQFRKLSRKIKGLQFNAQVQQTNSDKIFYGITASSGRAEGITTSDTQLINSDSILIIENDNVDDIDILKNVKGIISYNGGILSHLSIICREMNIPCLVGVSSPIPDGVKIFLDADNGFIKVLS
ncbi:hypothetical protein II906_00305 [bacterium]|nr:hypothetical protein [bacterium]